MRNYQLVPKFIETPVSELRSNSCKEITLHQSKQGDFVKNTHNQQSFICSDEELMVEMSASFSLHSGNLTLINFFDTKF